MIEEQPWDNETAARYIHALAGGRNVYLSKTLHARQRMSERGIEETDLLHVLKTGEVIGEAETCPQPGLFKYKIQAGMPRKGAYVVRAVVIPYPDRLYISIVTVMWAGKSPDSAGRSAGEKEAEK